jgi:alanine dehydrogenase
MLQLKEQFLLAKQKGVLAQFDRDQILSLGVMSHAMNVLRPVLESKGTAQLNAPPRTTFAVGAAGLTLTTGCIMHEDNTTLFGFRAYCRAPGVRAPDDDVTLLYGQGNRLIGVYVGGALGELRTGAIGGIAIALSASPDARICTVLGCGNQARAQALAVCVALPQLALIHVWCRTRERREQFARELRNQLPCDVVAAENVESAVAGCDVLIGATSSEAPVIEAAWLPPRIHINAIGPKFRDGSEFPPSVFDNSGLVFTDAIEQYSAPASRPLVALAGNRLACLGELLRTASSQRNDSRLIRCEKTVFLSQGLASTELAVLDTLLAKNINSLGVSS